MTCQQPSCTKVTGCGVTATTSTVTATPTIVVGPAMEILEIPIYDNQLVIASQPGLNVDLGPESGTTPGTQPASPIADLPCRSNVSPAIPASIPVGGKNVKLDDLLYSIRQQLCAGPCSAPAGVDSKYVAIFQKDIGKATDTCEISVGVTNQVEAYFIRETKPDGVQWQECWDASAKIIDKCVQNGPNTGWWNGKNNLIQNFHHRKSC